MKDNVNRIKKQAKEWEKIFANHISVKGLVSRIYKEFLLIIKRQPMKKMRKGSEFIQGKYINGQ